DEELGAGRMRVHGAGHGDGANGVADAVVGFVLDRRAGILLHHARLEAAALDHEIVDHPVEDGVVVMAVTHVLLEVLDGFRCLVGALPGKSSRVMSPKLGCSLTMRLILALFVRVELRRAMLSSEADSGCLEFRV